MQIRQAEEKDAEVFWHMDAECFSSYWKKKDWESFLRAEQYQGFVIETTHPVGFLLVSYAADEGEIIKIGISPEERKYGYADKLLKNGIEFFKTKGVSRIFLEVRETNEAARKLYENNNFQEIGIRKNYYHDPVEHGVLYLKECK